MATESSFNPLPAIVHLVAIAIGVLLGLRAMDALAPDLPAAEVEPGIESSVAPGAVAGGDPDSLFRAANLAPALDQLEGQIAAGDGIVSLRIEPGSVSAATGSDERLFEPDDVSPNLPSLLASEILGQRSGTTPPARVTLDDVRYMDLVATRRGPRWYVQLEGRDGLPPPWTYGAPIDGAPLRPGPATPVPVVEP